MVSLSSSRQWGQQRPFAEHLTPQILKGTGSVEFVDESGIHVIDDESASNVTSAADQSDELSSSEVSAPSMSVAKKRVYAKQSQLDFSQIT